MSQFDNHAQFIDSLTPNTEISISPRGKVELINELYAALDDLKELEKSLEEQAKEMDIPVRKLRNHKGELAHLPILTARVQVLTTLSRLT